MEVEHPGWRPPARQRPARRPARLAPGLYPYTNPANQWHIVALALGRAVGPAATGMVPAPSRLAHRPLPVRPELELSRIRGGAANPGHAHGRPAGFAPLRAVARRLA